MNIDLLPLAAFALETSGANARPCPELHTLTLRLARPAHLSSYESPMSGQARIEDSPLPSESVLRAAILPAEGAGLTITF